jgi:uncharacterized protein
MIKKFMIGIISDTHGLFRPEIITIFKGSNLIIHAGDIGNSQVLDGLKAISKVIAVRGNNDTGEWASRLPETNSVTIQGISILIIHDLKELKLEPKKRGINVVICGHSHCPKVENRQDVLYVNPGSAGPRRFKLPVAVARLSLKPLNLETEIVELSV